MDCSVSYEKEINKILESQLGEITSSIRFFCRRNWNLNQGAQLDYLYLLDHAFLQIPKHVFFMQDHYLNTETLVKSDTIPAGEHIDLKKCAEILAKNSDQVLFNTRYGFRISSFASEKARLSNSFEFSSDNLDLCLEIDGSNFLFSPEKLLSYYRDNQNKFMKGNGKYSFAHVWEARLSKILLEQGYIFREISRDVLASSHEELLVKFPSSGQVWHYAFQNEDAYKLYGRDLIKLPFRWGGAYGLLKKYIYESCNVPRWFKPREIKIENSRKNVDI